MGENDMRNAVGSMTQAVAMCNTLTTAQSQATEQYISCYVHIQISATISITALLSCPGQLRYHVHANDIH
eukprot:9382086-Karenia_brevis.AAC.1